METIRNNKIRRAKHAWGTARREATRVEGGFGWEVAAQCERHQIT